MVMTTATATSTPGKTIQTVNPATGEQIATYGLYDPEKALAAVKKASAVFESRWSKTPIGEREHYLKKLASALRSKKSDYAKIMTLEMGKPITQALAEVEKCAWAAEFYAENADEWLREEFSQTDAKISYVRFDPLGVVLSIMPWNFPFWQALRFAIPAIVAGNTSVLRHSNVCPGSALAR